MQHEVETELLDMLRLSFSLKEHVTADMTLVEAGMDSLDAVQAQLLLEDRWGEKAMHEYRPDENTKISEIAAEVVRRTT